MEWNAAARWAVAKLLGDGMSAGQIAQTLPFDVSRNAVIGIVHRDKALRAIGFGNPPRRPRAKKENEPPMLKPEHRKPSIHGPAGERIRSAQGAVKETTPMTGQPPKGVVSTWKPVGVPLVAIRDGLCRFPLWDNDGAPDFLMCGCATPIGQIYCHGHRARTATARAA